jgi:tetratricopeptide (TPR) repeat protein
MEREAESELRRAVELLSAGVGADHLYTVMARSAHALAQGRLGLSAEASAEFGRIHMVGDSSTPNGAFLNTRLGMLRALQGKCAEAEAILDPAITTLRASSPSAINKLAFARALNALGEASLETQHPERALALLTEARDIFHSLQPNGSTDSADNQVLTGRALLALNRRDDALNAFAAAREFWERFDSGNRYARAARDWHARATATTTAGSGKG